MKRKAAVKPFGTLTKPISEEIGFVYSLQPTPPESDVGFVIIWSNPKTAGVFTRTYRVRIFAPSVLTETPVR